MKLFSIPNITTALNLLCGIIAILLSLAGRIDLAPFAIYLGAIFDFLDGFLARKLNAHSELGKQLDSLADMVTFGVAPGVLMMVVMITTIYMEGPFYTNNFPSHVHAQLLNWINAVFNNVPNRMDASIKYLPFTALIIPFMSLFRLAKFNLDTRQSDSFIGVPTPLNTVFITFFPLVLAANFETWKFNPGIYGVLFNSYFLVAISCVMSILLIVELPLFSLKFKHFKWKGNEIRYVFLITCGLLIPFLLVWSIPLIVFLQIILSVINTQVTKNKENEIQS